MIKIAIILGSVRQGRKSPRVAQFLSERLRRAGAETELLDLKEYNFPIMEERLRILPNPPAGLREFAAKIVAADALVFVTPEYNNGIPGVLKNTIDYLLPELKRKPVGIATVSAGPFGGIYCLAQLRLVLLAMGAVVLPASMPVSKVQDSFDEAGNPTDEAYEKRAQGFIDELLWLTSALSPKR